MVMTLLTCGIGNELVSCGNDFVNLWERVSFLVVTTF